MFAVEGRRYKESKVVRLKDDMLSRINREKLKELNMRLED